MHCLTRFDSLDREPKPRMIRTVTTTTIKPHECSQMWFSALGAKYSILSWLRHSMCFKETIACVNDSMTFVFVIRNSKCKKSNVGKFNGQHERCILLNYCCKNVNSRWDCRAVVSDQFLNVANHISYWFPLIDHRIDNNHLAYWFRKKGFREMTIAFLFIVVVN